MKIPSSCLVFAIAFLNTPRTQAQEVRFVDLTTVKQKITLRTSPVPEQPQENLKSGIGIGGFSSSVLIGDCGVGANEPRSLRTTITWLDRSS
jgi:hypothetical protein